MKDKRPSDYVSRNVSSQECHSCPKYAGRLSLKGFMNLVVNLSCRFRSLSVHDTNDLIAKMELPTPVLGLYQVGPI